MPFRLACVSTGDDLHSIEDTSPFQSSYWAAVLYNCNVFQFTNPHYSAGASAEGNHIYVHALPDIAENDRFTTDISSMREESASEFLRLTQYGQIRVGSDGGEQGFGEYQLSGDLN